MEAPHPDSCNFSDDPELRGMLGIGWFWLPIWSVVWLAALVALGLGAKPGYRAYRAHRAERNLQAAMAAADHGDWATARDKAHSVLLVRGQDLQARRIWTRALTQLGTPDAYTAAAGLFATPGASRGDLLETLQMMATQAPQAVALSAYASLPPALLAQADFRAAITPLLVRRGELALAEANLREVAQATDAPKVRLELLRVLSGHADASRVAEARHLFAGLVAAKADAEALAGLVLLGECPGGLAPGGELPDLPAWLISQPQATTLHHLLGMTPALEAQPEAAPRLYQAAVARFLADDPGVLGGWLSRRGQAAMAAKVLASAAATRPDAYLARIHALLRLRNGSALATALAAVPDSCDLVEVELVQAAFATNRGEPIAEHSAWARALSGAVFDTSRNRCLDIARAADLCGAKDAAEDAWVAAVRLGWGPLPLYRDLLPVFASLAAKGRSEDLLAMYRTLHRLEPHNPELLNNFCYFALIHSVMSPGQVASLMASLMTKPAGHSNAPLCHSTLMLAEMLDGRPTAALARLPRFRASKQVQPMMHRALEGTARVLAGDAAAGAALLAEVDWRSFMSQERIVFRSLLARSKNSELPLPKLASSSAEAAPDQIPAWRKAVERMEKNRQGDVLPALPAPHVPGATADERPAPP